MDDNQSKLICDSRSGPNTDRVRNFACIADMILFPIPVKLAILEIVLLETYFFNQKFTLHCTSYKSV